MTAAKAASRTQSGGSLGALSPEDVLLAWLLWLPSDVDPADVAAKELRRSGFRDPADPRVARLAELLDQVAAPPGLGASSNSKGDVARGLRRGPASGNLPS